jgi:tRNA 2-thiouridine synthesizing protein D
MHFVLAGTYGPTDPTRAMLPFIFAASAIESGDSCTLMLFHDAVLLAIDGVGPTVIPFGPPNRYKEVVGQSAVKFWVCKPCFDARGLVPSSLDRHAKLGGMGQFLEASKMADAKVVAF